MRPNLQLAAALLVAAGRLPAQHAPHAPDSASATRAIALHGGAGAILAAVRVSPAVFGRTLTEGYVTQPMLHGEAAVGLLLALRVMVNLEGATLRRGELTPGAYGEGYVDRRHPHAYLHEAVVTLRTPALLGGSASLSVGKGFAPFGTDDPMSRPVLRYPVNHHLAQVLERFIAVGALRWRGLAFEAGAFNGDEPESPGDAPNAANRWDSHALRLTVLPMGGLETQVSAASVSSPESPTGQGFDHEKASASIRWRGRFAGIDGYALAEWARNDLALRGRREFRTTSTLLEASARRDRVLAAVRVERTLRPEEERFTENLFRTAFPTAEVHIIGTTRFDVATAHVAADRAWRAFRVAPFVEVSAARPRAVTVPTFFVPRDFYGARTIMALSAGVRLGVGAHHGRVGRYGAAIMQPEHH